MKRALLPAALLLGAMLALVLAALASGWSRRPSVPTPADVVIVGAAAGTVRKLGP